MNIGYKILNTFSTSVHNIHTLKALVQPTFSRHFTTPITCQVIELESYSSPKRRDKSPSLHGKTFESFGSRVFCVSPHKWGRFSAILAHVTGTNH